MNYKIVIPSYNRLKILQKKTLAFLLKNNIPQEIIYIFVHPDSYDEYRILNTEYNINIIKSLAGIRDSRNFITEYFDEGQPIVSIDDDIVDLIDFRTDQPLENLNDFIEETFEMSHGGLWGLSATSNKFFSTRRDKLGLQSIIGSFCGYMNTKNYKLQLKVMEDYERVIYYYINKKIILKRGWVGIKTKYWTTAGGIQSNFSKEERITIQNEAATWLLKTYPLLVYTRTRKNGLIDIRFKTIKS